MSTWFYTKGKKHPTPGIIYNDVPDFIGSNPDCPVCDEHMQYSGVTGEFSCPACGFTIDDDAWNYNADIEGGDDIPWGCRQCGGDYPRCKTSCRMFDD